MANGNGFQQGSNGATNLSYTKFLFIVPRREDEAAVAKLRATGSLLSRGYFNDYEADGTRESQPRETIQFFVAEGQPIALHADMLQIDADEKHCTLTFRATFPVATEALIAAIPNAEIREIA